MSTIRELARLTRQGYVRALGNGRATRYAATSQASTLVLYDIEAYLAEEPDRRRVRYRGIEPQLFESVHLVFRSADLMEIDKVRVAYQSRQNVDPQTAWRELERFVIELSWKSSKIEGNTYTLLDTEQLIRQATEASGHTHQEALMILGHKRTFEYIWQHQSDYRTLTRQHIEDVHQLLTADLGVKSGLRSSGVGITGTAYLPPSSQTEVASNLDLILQTINRLVEPAEKALGVLVLLSYLQPFADGNKRTSRLIANAVLLAHNLPPLSYRSIDEQAYKGALILFYEQGTLANLRDLFLEQLRFAAMNYFW
ncbi:MAG: Fic family protein [Candidatus Dormibacteraceae bacterium]